MKSLLLVLALFFIAQNTMASSAGYSQLSSTTIKKSQLIQDLRDFGADYVVQQGVFQSPKNPLPGAYYEITKTEKVERKITSTTTYYRYTVILTEYDNLAVVRATYVVSFKPATGGVLVSSQSYRIIGGDKNGEQSVGGPSLIDVKPLNEGSDDELSSLLEEGLAYTISDAIQNGDLKESDYHLKYIANALLADSGYPSTFVFLVTLADSKGKTYRAQITCYSSEDGEEVDEEWLPEYVIFPNA